MTDRQARGARSKRRTAAGVYLTALTLFAIVASVLAIRVARGADPALGAIASGTVAAQRPVLIRKVVITRRVTTVLPAEPAPQSTAAAPAPQSVAVAPAPVAAQPAPAPPPAPVQTSTS